MSIKSKLGIMSMFASLAMMGTEMPNGQKNYGEKETDEEKKQRLAKAEIERNKANGLKEFFYGENSLWALNQKSADKKARKKNWL
jgi:hypothetical protein